MNEHTPHPESGGQPSRSDRIAAMLEEQILTGRFAPGSRLDEVSLAEEHRVSRTPIREAFQKLAQSGLVEHAPRRGVFVRQASPIEIMEMFEVMAEMEAVCGRLAALRSAEGAVDQLRTANAACRAALEAGDVDAYYVENGTFHHLIYAQSGNRFLEQEASRLHRRLKPYRRMQLFLRGRLAQSMGEHEAIVEAISRGDAAEASDLLRRHVAVQGEKFHHLLTQLRPDAAG
ncbi:GntR family transcriptional regulator [Primorskyibacter flagellatus]|uniref:GntR family transcriptional regulator n=1 Tax=Primorskyibacter flagellatus TaxID=1387277 RepID=A0A917EDS0_9RHOB|nr:GntR family transcriptional regulator [Primorskyibacter flagellatus]GGE28595.1 GntR family transcriptional regulator [Primorskyibacter flagellatus]